MSVFSQPIRAAQRFALRQLIQQRSEVKASDLTCLGSERNDPACGADTLEVSRPGKGHNGREICPAPEQVGQSHIFENLTHVDLRESLPGHEIEFPAKCPCHRINPHCPAIEIGGHRRSHYHSASGIDGDIEIAEQHPSGLKRADL